MDEGARQRPVPGQEEGWFPDPDLEGQERFWDGEAWTDEVRPEESGDARLSHLPEHVPELQRALAAATADIDSVEDRLSALFERSEGPPGSDPRPRPARVARLIPAEALRDDGAADADVEDDGVEDSDDDDVDDDDLLLQDFDEEPEVFEDEDDADLDAQLADDDVEDDEDDDEFADLDAALAAESPEEF